MTVNNAVKSGLPTLLVGLLFFQAAVNGLMLEFEDPPNAPVSYRTINGIWWGCAR